MEIVCVTVRSLIDILSFHECVSNKLCKHVVFNRQPHISGIRVRAQLREAELFPTSSLPIAYVRVCTMLIYYLNCIISVVVVVLAACEGI